MCWTEPRWPRERLWGFHRAFSGFAGRMGMVNRETMGGESSFRGRTQGRTAIRMVVSGCGSEGFEAGWAERGCDRGCGFVGGVIGDGGPVMEGLVRAGSR